MQFHPALECLLIQYGLHINILTGHIRKDGISVERVKQYTYPKCNINEVWDHSRELKTRIENCRTAFNKMHKIFKTHDLALKLTEASAKRLEAIEMWLYKRILKLSWKDKVTNAEIL